MKVFHPGSDDEVAKYRENLVSVKHPSLAFESVGVVELFDLLGDSFGAGHDRLEFIDGRT